MSQRFSLLRNGSLTMLLFWIVTPCGLVGRYQCFGETSALKKDTVCLSKTLVSTNESTWRRNPEERY
jgi:hypothetical protein